MTESPRYRHDGAVARDHSVVIALQEIGSQSLGLAPADASTIVLISSHWE